MTSWRRLWNDRAQAEVAERSHACLRKVRHPTKASALAEARWLGAQRGIALMVYPCPWCAGWHLTKARAGRAA
jgi:hypothetical protein